MSDFNNFLFAMKIAKDLIDLYLLFSDKSFSILSSAWLHFGLTVPAESFEPILFGLATSNNTEKIWGELKSK